MDPCPVLERACEGTQTSTTTPQAHPLLLTWEAGNGVAFDAAAAIFLCLCHHDTNSANAHSPNIGTTPSSGADRYLWAGRHAGPSWRLNARPHVPCSFCESILTRECARRCWEDSSKQQDRTAAADGVDQLSAANTSYHARNNGIHRSKYLGAKLTSQIQCGCHTSHGDTACSTVSRQSWCTSMGVELLCRTPDTAHVTLCPFFAVHARSLLYLTARSSSAGSACGKVVKQP